MRILHLFFFATLVSCGARTGPDTSVQTITESKAQDSIFNNLLLATNNGIPENLQQDSLAFLILPLQVSCPACRNKTIDSIAKYSERLLPNHFIILSAKGGKKTIKGFFKAEDVELPDLPGLVFLDSTDVAGSYNLYQEKPTMYYTCNKKAFKKVASVPATVKNDLHQFFSGKHYSDQAQN